MSALKARGESWGSDSFSVVSLSDYRDSGDENDVGELQVLVTTENEPFTDVSISVGAEDALEVESHEWEDVDVEIEALGEDGTSGEDPVAVVVMEPHEIVSDYCENPRPRVDDAHRERTRSRSREAKEALMAFYLGRAKLSEKRSKAFVVAPAPPVEIPPLKAPVERYTVPVREEVLRIENERRAKSALEEFYRRRDDTKLKRAALNRMNEFKLYQTQCGLTTTGSIIKQQL